MKLKSVLSSVGNGILITGSAINNAPINERIREIDAEIEELQKEKAKLKERLISYS